MATGGLDSIIAQADALPAEEQLRLIAHLVERVRRSYRSSGPRTGWRDLAGTIPYPAVGEDAQEWVSRTRREADDRREQAWAPKP